MLAQENTLLNMQMVAGCQPTQRMESLSEEFGEIPFVGGPSVFRRWDGEFAEGVFKMYVNPRTNTFTATVEFPEDDITCIVFMGKDLQPIAQGQAL